MARVIVIGKGKAEVSRADVALVVAAAVADDSTVGRTIVFNNGGLVQAAGQLVRVVGEGPMLPQDIQQSDQALVTLTGSDSRPRRTLL